MMLSKNMQKTKIDLLNELKNHYLSNNLANLKDLFRADHDRGKKFCLKFEDIALDYSKYPIDSRIIELLAQLADAAALPQYIAALYNGEKINITEDRAVLHHLLRTPQTSVKQQNKLSNQLESVTSSLKAMTRFTKKLVSGEYKSATNCSFTDVVNIGIGGSDLGPRMVCRSLSPYKQNLNCHFVANLDSADMADTLQNLDPNKTLFIITSKSFTTLETMENAQYAKIWLTKYLTKNAKIGKHFVAVTSQADKARDYGIEDNNIFEFWDWVGGRFSLWGAVGLPIMLYIGEENFMQLLAGAHWIDEQFATEELTNNLPLLFGMLSYYMRVCCEYNNSAIVPYAQRLEFLPSYLQQLLMESNGKSARKSSLPQPGFDATGGIIWGNVGSNAQHAFFQLLHQGTQIAPVEFIAFCQSFEKCDQAKRQQKQLIANCFAQSQALLEGTKEASEKHLYCPGNKPSLTLLCKKLTPYILGKIIALYEARTFVEGVLMDINSFDQWGVELGKSLAKNIYTQVEKAISEPSTEINSNMMDIYKEFSAKR